MGCVIVSLRNLLLTLQGDIVVLWDIFTLEGVATVKYSNSKNQLPTNMVPHPRRLETSVTLLQKTRNSQTCSRKNHRLKTEECI